MGYLMAYVVAFGSLMAGATVVHTIYKPDLVTITLAVAFHVGLQTSCKQIDFHCVYLRLPCRRFQQTGLFERRRAATVIRLLQAQAEISSQNYGRHRDHIC